MDSREQFEQAYSDDNGGVPVGFIKLQRQGDSYSVPKVARAWYWWKRSREAVVVELPIDVTGGHYRLAVESCKRCIEAAGVKVAP